jgi:alkanesulfonate monooxygenase SsuD/methylene tetrahydromethanopterin reductase-like flavin-dependent oxidoreductase (luciferase family)
MRSTSSFRRALGLTACLALATALAACGSDDEGDEAGARDAGAICAAVDQFRDAAVTNDRADMAAAIRPIVEDLPEEVARQAEAYIVTLNGSETFTGTANDRSREEFLAYADETCGEGEDSGSGSDASTTSTSPGATSTTMPDDLTPTTTAATGDGNTGTNEGSGSGSDPSGSGGSTESDGSTGSSGSSDPATSGPSEGTGG